MSAGVHRLVSTSVCIAFSCLQMCVYNVCRYCGVICADVCTERWLRMRDWVTFVDGNGVSCLRHELLYICKLLLAMVQVFELFKLIPVIHIGYISDLFYFTLPSTCLQLQVCNLLILFSKPLCAFLDRLVIWSRLSLAAPGLSPRCTRGQCLSGSDSHFYLKRPELWDREGEHLVLATAVGVSLGETDQVITPTCIFSMLSLTIKFWNWTSIYPCSTIQISQNITAVEWRKTNLMIDYLNVYNLQNMYRIPANVWRVMSADKNDFAYMYIVMFSEVYRWCLQTNVYIEWYLQMCKPGASILDMIRHYLV